jgi:acyl carrier protein
VGVEAGPQIAVREYGASLRPVEDLDLDSLPLLQLVDLIEDRSRGGLPDETIQPIDTLGDAFHFYAAMAGRERAARGPR